MATFDGLAIGAPALALSVRKVVEAFAGSCMRVRRSSDNTELDIGFDSSGGLDQTALLAHVGAGSGFLAKWYDQSGNARDAIQATLASQPRIVNAGTVDKLNTVPSPLFIGSTFLIVTGFIYQPKTLVAVTKATVSGGYSTITRQEAGTGQEWAFRCLPGEDRPYFYSLSGGYKQIGPNSSGSSLSFWIFTNTSTATIWRNGTSDSTQTQYTFSATTNGNIGVGSNGSGGEIFSGSISELGLFSSAASTSSDRFLIGKSVKSYYSIVVNNLPPATLMTLGVG